MKPDEFKEFKKKIRTMIADYMWSEGCSCCQNIDAHKEHTERLAKLLHVPKYSDGSGYDFSKFRSKK
jgi:hypothetical protein